LRADGLDVADWAESPWLPIREVTSLAFAVLELAEQLQALPFTSGGRKEPL